MHRWLLALVALTAACADLPPLASNECGNGVKDENEDCDSFVDPELGPGTACGAPSSGEQACRYTCSASVSCPVGWGCGEGGICRFSSGAFVPGPESPVALSAERLELGDVDGDGRPDLIGFDSAAIEVRFGTPDGRFPTGLDTTTDSPTGAQTLADLDQDGRTDVLVPLVGGLFVLLGQSSQTLAPIAFAPFDIPSALGGLQIFPVRVENGSPFDSLLFIAGTCMQVFDESQADCLAGGGTPLPTKPAGAGVGSWTARDIAGRIPKANAHGVLQDAEEIALAFSGSPEVYIYAAQLNQSRFKMVLVDTVKLPLGRTVLFGARFADLNGDGHMDLMVSVGTPGDDAVAVAAGDGSGTFTDAIVDPVFDQMMPATDPGGPVQTVQQRWPLAVGQLNADGVADYVGQNGVYLRAGGFLFQSVYRTTPDPWSEAEIADFNRDGFADVAMAAEGQEDLDFYVGTGTGVFNYARINTDTAPFFLRSGDFDGDLVVDLAVGLPDPVTGRGDDSLAILFGNLQGPPSPPVSMGRLQRIEFLEPARAVISLETLDMVSDVVVQSAADTMTDDRSLALMFGSSQRRLISPFTLQPAQGSQDVPIAVLGGRFDPSSDEIPDMVAIAPPDAWLIKGKGQAQFTAQDAKHQPLEEVFGAGGADAFNPFCALFAVVDVNDDGRDEVVGVDNTARCGFGFGGSPTPRLLVAQVQEDSRLQVSLFDVPGDVVVPVELRLADLNDDGDMDLVVVFAGDRSAAGAGDGVDVTGDGVLVYWGNGTGFDAQTPSVVPAFPGATLRVSAAALNADEDKRMELAVLTDAGVYVTNFDDGGAFDTPGAPVVFVTGRSLQAADVNADGLADLLFLDERGEQAFVYLAVPNLDETKAVAP
jgi:hypothetical protein